MAVAESESERRHFLGLMTKDVSRLERLVSGLRDVARVEREIEQDASGPVDLVNLLREVIDGVETTSGPQLCLAVDPIGARPVVHASRDRLAQVFENLIANAMSFAPHGTPVDVRVTAARGSASVTVEDHGPGIPEAHLDRVFRRFFTYRPTEGRGDHVGLGLAIARQIVESYNGEISAANRSGGGARLEVRLPAS